VTATDQPPVGCSETDRLRTILALHAIALGSMPCGLCMLDAEHRVVLFNRRFVEIYGLPPRLVRSGISLREILKEVANRASLSGTKLEDIWEEHRIGLARGEPFVRKQRLSNGAIVAARFQRIAGDGWLSTHEDTTAHCELEESLCARIECLNDVLGNTSHGLCLFGADERLILCNDQYLKIYGFDRDTIKPGITYRNILTHATNLDKYRCSSLDELYDRCMAAVRKQEMARYCIHLTGDRIIEKVVRPLSDGRWIADHEDVTIKQRHEKALRERNLLLDAALDRMAHGLCAFDQDLRVIVVNQRYLKMYGLEPELAQPGTALIDLMRRSIARGIHCPGVVADEMFADFKTRLIESKEPVLHRRLADGRVIAVRHQPMANGGWVGTYEDITEQRRAEENIARMARHDALTDLPNRLLFKERMTDGLARVEASNESMAVICIDIDNFKLINDSLGHPIGDKLLCKVAKRLSSSINQGDTIARIGGDEFAILHFVNKGFAVEVLAQSILASMEEPIVIDGQKINAGISIGIALAPNDGTCGDRLMMCADLALYSAKAQGRNTFRCFEPDMSAKVAARRALELDMRHALTAGEFELVYQPVVNAVTSELVGMEALLRWTHRERGPVPPSEFIRVAEETGLIVPLGEWVLRKACSEAGHWPEPINIAVNLSPVQFRHPGIVTSIMQALASANLSARRLEIEITEAVLLQDDPTIIEILHQLRSLGARISMDDFGTGYSSLSYLRSFPFDKIKIDRSFISEVDRVPNSKAIVCAIAGLGAALGITITAEGVETAEQLEFVRRAGCTEVQGYLISRPRPVADLPALIRRLRRTAAAA
jgi:diguanylate cyclase (GGDEF)-like protein